MANSDLSAPNLPTPRLEFIFEARVTIGPPQELGDIAKGVLRIVPITGGDFAGPDLGGEVLPGGADRQILRDDGVSELDASYRLCTDDGGLIDVHNLALRHGPTDSMAALAAGRPVDPGSYYFRGATFFETSAARHAWLTDHIIVCTGHREPALVKVEFYRID